MDDLWSLLYSLIEIGEGALPWRLIEDQLEVMRIKLETKIYDMLRFLHDFSRYNKFFFTFLGAYRKTCANFPNIY